MVSVNSVACSVLGHGVVRSSLLKAALAVVTRLTTVDARATREAEAFAATRRRRRGQRRGCPRAQREAVHKYFYVRYFGSGIAIGRGYSYTIDYDDFRL